MPIVGSTAAVLVGKKTSKVKKKKKGGQKQIVDALSDENDS